MPPKLRHECERCGLVAEFERAGRFRDEDFHEVFQERLEFEARLRQRTREHRDLAAKLFIESSETAFWLNQAALYRAQLVAAGVDPMDCRTTAEAPPQALELAENPFA